MDAQVDCEVCCISFQACVAYQYGLSLRVGMILTFTDSGSRKNKTKKHSGSRRKKRKGNDRLRGTASPTRLVIFLLLLFRFVYNSFRVRRSAGENVSDRLGRRFSKKKKKRTSKASLANFRNSLLHSTRLFSHYFKAGL